MGASNGICRQSGSATAFAFASLLLVAWISTGSMARGDDAAAPNEAVHDHEHAADEAHGEHAGEDLGGHAHHAHTIHGEHPKNYFGQSTEFLYWSPQLFIWTLLLFLALWFLLARLVWHPLMNALDERDHRISESLAMAQKLRDEAKSITAELDPDTIKAQQEARHLLDQARADAAREINELITEAREESTRRQRAANEEIEAATQQGLAEIEASAQKIGASIADTLVKSGRTT